MNEQVLPRVSLKMRERFLKYVSDEREEGEGPGVMFVSWHQILEDENPLLFELMRETAKKYSDPSQALVDFMTLYVILHHQALEDPRAPINLS